MKVNVIFRVINKLYLDVKDFGWKLYHSISNLELYLNQWNWTIQNENCHIGSNDGDDGDLWGQVHGGKPQIWRQLGVHCKILLFVTQWKVWIWYWVSWGDFDKIVLKGPWIINLQEYATQNFDLYYDTKTQWPLVYGDDSNLTSCRDKESVLQVSFLKLSWSISNFSLQGWKQPIYQSDSRGTL